MRIPPPPPVYHRNVASKHGVRASRQQIEANSLSRSRGVKSIAISSAVATVAVIITLVVLGAVGWVVIETMQKAKEIATGPIVSTSDAPSNIYGPEVGRTTARLVDGSLPGKDPKIERSEAHRAAYQRWYAEQIASTTDIGELIASRDSRTVRAALIVQPGATWRGWARGRQARLVGFKVLDARMPNLKTPLVDAYIDTETWHDQETELLIGAMLCDPKDNGKYSVIADVALADCAGDEYPNLIIRKIYAPPGL